MIIIINLGGKRRSSGSLSPRLALFRRRESIDGFTQDELSHEHETNNVQKIIDHFSPTSPVAPSSGLKFNMAPSSPKRCNKFITRPGVGSYDPCPSPTRIPRRAESPLCSRAKRRYVSDSHDEPKKKVRI